MSQAIYLKVRRKRAGFTQGELAYLLGGKKSSTVSRYELGERHPDLATAFLYQLIFDRELKELFSGLFADMRMALAERVRELLNESASANSAQGKYTRGKLEQLAKRLAKSAPRV